MHYQTFEPDQDLAAFVKCYWTLDSPAEEPPAKQTIVPDGCMEMIFHVGDLYHQYLENGDKIIQPRCFVIGQLTRPLDIEPTGRTGIFSVRFHPDGFVPFAGIPVKEMENLAVPLDRLFGNEGLNIEKKILNVSSPQERIRLIENFLFDRLADAATIDRIVSSTVETILTANGQLSVEELSRQTKVTRRQLERKFASVIGLSPKQLSKIVRLQATLKLLLHKKVASFTELAYAHEYYDQAHFIKDFKEFTGCTPKEFYSEQLRMSVLFFGSE